MSPNPDPNPDGGENRVDGARAAYRRRAAQRARRARADSQAMRHEREYSPRNSPTQISYFCEGDRNRFARRLPSLPAERPGSVIKTLLLPVQEASQMWANPERAVTTAPPAGGGAATSD